MRPGIRNRPVPKKRQHRVRAKGATQYLRALDPLLPGRAGSVRSEWVSDKSDATAFDSAIYAAHVAQNNPGQLPFYVEPM